MLYAPLRASAMESISADGAAVTSRRLDGGWEFRKSPVDGIWGVWRTEDNDLWETAALPHCFNATDACDPDQPYFRGQGWYRTRLEVKNPFAEGRTILHFQGAGQTTTVWVGSRLIGTHKGGYDEFVFDITEAVRQLPAAESKGGVPIAVLCDNSPDLGRVPSDLSDFCLYGGLYRHVNLAYLPALALDAVQVLPTISADGTTQVSVKARLFNPTNSKLHCTSGISVEVSDADSRSIHRATQTVPVWAGPSELTSFHVAAPALWSPETPHLYRCRVTLTTPAGTTSLDERFGIRQAEFVEHGPFKLNGKRVLLRGTQRHADHAGLAAAMPDDLVRQEMQLIREMGANFIRLAHYQQEPPGTGAVR